MGGVEGPVGVGGARGVGGPEGVPGEASPGMRLQHDISRKKFSISKLL